LNVSDTDICFILFIINIILVAERFASAVSAFWSHNKAYGDAFQKSGFLSFLQMKLMVTLTNRTQLNCFIILAGPSPNAEYSFCN
jgi:hypothetical protein